MKMFLNLQSNLGGKMKAANIRNWKYLTHLNTCLFIVLVISLCPIKIFAKDYKGAELYSIDEVTYGKWEFRMMAAKASGTLSTFFLYKEGSQIAGSLWEEVDVEIKGKDNADYFQSNIISGLNGGSMSEQMHGPYGFGDGFHTFVVEWTPGKVVWKIDGDVVRTTSGGQADDLVSAMGTRFNLWSAYSEGWVGAFNPADLPVHQFVNWIEYSSYTPETGDNGSDFTLQWRDDFNALDGGPWLTANWTFDANRVDFEPDNVVVQDGMLVLALTTADATGFNGSVPVDPDDQTTNIVSDASVSPGYKTNALPVEVFDVSGKRMNVNRNGLSGASLEFLSAEKALQGQLTPGVYTIRQGDHSRSVVLP